MSDLKSLVDGTVIAVGFDWSPGSEMALAKCIRDLADSSASGVELWILIAVDEHHALHSEKKAEDEHENNLKRADLVREQTQEKVKDSVRVRVLAENVRPQKLLVEQIKHLGLQRLYLGRHGHHSKLSEKLKGDTPHHVREHAPSTCDIVVVGE